MALYVNGVDITKISSGNAIAKDNTQPYTPTGPYNPATKKYVDDAVGTTGSQTYVHTQSISSVQWVITHNLGRYPAITVVDSANNVVVGDIKYDSSNQVTLTFAGSFAGQVYCN